MQAACSNGLETIIPLFLKKGADVNAQEKTRETPLQRACFQKDERTVRLLLDERADVNARGGCYGNALQAACYNWSKNRETDKKAERTNRSSQFRSNILHKRFRF